MLLSTFVFAALAVQGVIASPSSASLSEKRGTPATLNDKLVSYKKQFWGNIVDTFGAHSINNPTHTDIVKREFGSVTAEDATTWGATEPTQGTFSFTRADAVVNWAVANGKLFRGHSLVWHSQAPGWLFRVTDPNVLTAAITTHVTTLAARYKGKVKWDVVTEAIGDSGGFRNTVFYNVLGESYIPLAFKTARAADPQAKLYINDYNLHNSTKLDPLVALVTKLNKENPGLIDGIGTEMHLTVDQNGNQASLAQSSLATLATAGTEISITELDIQGGAAADYVSVVTACVKNPACVSITSWGVSDADSWRPAATPLLWDSQYQPKAAYNAILALPATL